MLTAKDPSLTGQSKSGQSSSSARTTPRRRRSPRINFMISPQTGSPLCVAFNLDHRRLIDLVLHNPCPSPCPGPSGLSAAISPPVFVLIWQGALPRASKGHLPQSRLSLGQLGFSLRAGYQLAHCGGLLALSSLALRQGTGWTTLHSATVSTSNHLHFHNCNPKIYVIDQSGIPS